MASLTFQHLQFYPENKGSGLRIVFLERFQFLLSADDLAAAGIQPGTWEAKGQAITFPALSERQANHRFSQLLDKGFQRLESVVTGKRAIYVHQNSGIPLIGTNEFGLVDRDTNIIEVKPITGCNLACIYCSVNEGRDPRNSKEYDFVVEPDYLVQGCAALIKPKEGPIEINIGPQGEPLLYAAMAELIQGLKSLPKVKTISINTNGLLLTKPLIDRLAAAGLDRINLSLNSLDQDIADRLSSRSYNLPHLLRMVDYAKGKLDILLAPVIVPGINDDQLGPIIELALRINPERPLLGVQNFLNYPRGRNPVKQRSWEEFFALLKTYEDRYQVKLRVGPEDFQIVPQKTLQKPFVKGDVVKAAIVAPSRFPHEMLAAAKGRCISVQQSDAPVGSQCKLRIVRDKHNIYKAVVA